MRWFTVSLVAVALMVLVGMGQAEGEIVLTFDDIPAHEGNDINDVIREEYAHLAVHFNSDGRHSGIVRLGVSQGDPGNWSLEGSNGPQFLGHNSSGRTGLIEFDVPLMDFQIDAGRGFEPGIINLTFDAYDASGLLESVSLPSSIPDVWETISFSATGITRIEYYAESNFALDNMRFTPVPEPSTLILLSMGGVGLLAYAWRPRKRLGQGLPMQPSRHQTGRSASQQDRKGFQFHRFFQKERNSPMRNVLLTLLVAAGMILLGGPAFGDPVAHYRMKIDGVHAPEHLLAHGTTHTLSVEVLVTDNYLLLFDLGDGEKHYHGGVVFYSFHLDNDPDEDITWAEGITGIPPRPDGKWKSRQDPAFTTHLKGELHYPNKPEVLAETGMILPDNYFEAGNFYRFGGAANPPGPDPGQPQWAQVVEGDFTWNSDLTQLVLSPSAWDSTLVYTLDGQQPPSGGILGDQTLLKIPEPSTWVLLATGLGAVLAYVWRKPRRRRRTAEVEGATKTRTLLPDALLRRQRQPRRRPALRLSVRRSQRVLTGSGGTNACELKGRETMFRQSENRTLNLRIVTAFAMLLAAIPVGALGATSLFTNRGEFEAAAPRPLLLETCEDDPVGALSVPATLLGSGLIVDTDPRAVTTEITTSESYSFNTTPGGEKHLRFRYRQDYTATVLAPGYPIFGFGFDLSGFQDHLGRGGFDVVLSRDQHVVDSFKVPDPGDFGPNFHGIVSGAPFDAVSLTLLDGDYVGLDDISCDVPEPGTLGLLAMGGVALLLLSGSVSLSRKGRLMRSFVVGLVALVVLIGFGTVDGAVLTVYTDRPGWEAAVSSFVTEDFNSLSNTPPFSAGLTHVGLIDIEIVGHPHNNRIDDGTATSFYTDGTRFVVGTAAGTQHSLPGLPSIVFPSPVYGFAALWDSTHTLARLTTQMGTEVVHFDDYLPGSGDGFLGVVSDAAFNRADFDVEDQGSLEGFAFDNLSFAAIPEPRTLILLATGALGLLACGWRRKRR